MDIIYYLINFAILVALIWLVGRKTIIGIFRTRREAIEKSLAECQAPEQSGEVTSAQAELPDLPVLDRSEVEEARVAAEEKLRQIQLFGAREYTEARRTVLNRSRRDFFALLREQLAELFSQEEYYQKIRAMEPELVDQIIAQLHLTGGDFAYLRRKQVLYVNVFSAFPLPEELLERLDRASSELLASVGGKTSFRYQVDPSLIGGLRFRIGDTMYDASVEEEWYNFKTEMLSYPITGEETLDDFMQEFSRRAAEQALHIHIYQRGRVLTVSDGICWMDGLSDIMYGEIVELAHGERGMVLDIQAERVGCVIFGKYERIESGSRVRRVGRTASVPVGEALLGRVVDAIGEPIDAKGLIACREKRPIEFSSPAILDRAPVNQPLHTGIKAIDALVPIGKGQRELLIGDRQSGKTAIAMDTILNQKGKNTVCIYVAIGQKEAALSEMKERLEREGAMEYTVIVAATASDSAAMQYTAPFAGTAMGEYFMYAGRDVLIIYDDLSKHAVAYRELSLLLQRPSGREAYPGDIFYLHSRLLERSAHLSAELGGGSMTALPIIETQAGDISSYIPTNVISITDGQIFLESDLFYEGQRPAINVGLSVSRVGGNAQTGLMKQISANLRTKLAQFRELSDFTQFGTDIDEATKRVLASGKRLMEALKQDRYLPLEDWKQALLIYAVAEGFARDVDVDAIGLYEKKLYPYFEERFPALVAELKTGKKMSPDRISTLRAALSQFAEEF